MIKPPNSWDFYKELEEVTGLTYYQDYSNWYEQYKANERDDIDIFITPILMEDRPVAERHKNKIIVADFGYLPWFEIIDPFLLEEDLHRWYRIEKRKLESLPDFFSPVPGYCVIWDNREGEIKGYLGIYTMDSDDDVYAVAYIVNEKQEPIPVNKYET